MLPIFLLVQFDQRRQLPVSLFLALQESLEHIRYVPNVGAPHRQIVGLFTGGLHLEQSEQHLIALLLKYAHGRLICLHRLQHGRRVAAATGGPEPLPPEDTFERFPQSTLYTF
jgi:hypothetical protein